jgi:hypothetical protein
MLDDIDKIIKAQEPSFGYYVRKSLLKAIPTEDLEFLLANFHVIVFSGVIRDFLTGDVNGTPRDLDLTILSKNKVRRADLKRFFDNTIISLIRPTKLGGVKIKLCSSLVVDVWPMDKTWGLLHRKLEPSIDNLIESCFFNFSAIAYDLNKQRFVFDDKFKNFLQTGTIDIVYPENPDIAGCIISIMFHMCKSNCLISKRLAIWVYEHYSSGLDFETVQKRRYGSILFNKNNVYDFYRYCAIKVNFNK